MKTSAHFLLGAVLAFAGTASTAILPIYPADNTAIQPDELSAVYTFDNQIVANIDRYRFHLWYNDVDVSSMIAIEENSLFFTPSEKLLSNPALLGPASLKLYVSTIYDERNEVLVDSSIISFSVFVKGTDPQLIDSTPQEETYPFVNTGTVYTNHRYDNTGNTGLYTGELGASGNGYKNKFYYNYNLYLNTDEDSHAQTMQRFRAVAGFSHKLKLGIGDVTPLMNEYIANGDRVRGVELNLSSPSRLFNFDAVYGFSKRAVDPFISDAQLLSRADSLARSVGRSLSHNDSALYIASGTFQRQVIGTRLHLGSGERVKYGLTAMQVRDLVESIEQNTMVYETIAGTDTIRSSVIAGTAPQDNLLVGQDLALAFWKNRITFYSNAAMSISNSDIHQGPLSSEMIEKQFDIDPGTIPFDFEKLEPLIIVNQNVRPLPAGNGLLNSSAFDAGIRINTPIASNREKLDVKFYQIGSNFKSLLNESIPSNRRGFYVREELRLWDNRIMGYGKFDYYQDNVDEQKLIATKTRKATGSINLLLRDDIPQFSFAVSSFRDKNESAPETKLDKDNSTLLFDIRSSYRRHIGNIDNTFSLYYTTSGAEMYSSSAGKNNIESNGFGADIITKYPTIPLKSRVGYSQSFDKSEVIAKSFAPKAGLTFTIIPEKLDLHGDLRYYIRNSEDEISGSTTEFRRIEGWGVATYRFHPKHLLSFNASGMKSGTKGDTNSSYDYRMNLYYEFRY